MSVEALPSPSTEPKPPSALPQTLNGLAASQAELSHACASARAGRRPAALAAARVGHLLAERVHEQCIAREVHGAEVGPRLAADRAERLRSELRVEPGQGADHGREVSGCRGVGLVEGVAHRPLVGRVALEAAERGALQRQGQEHIVGVIGQRRGQEGEVFGEFE